MLLVMLDFWLYYATSYAMLLVYCGSGYTLLQVMLHVCFWSYFVWLHACHAAGCAMLLLHYFFVTLCLCSCKIFCCYFGRVVPFSLLFMLNLLKTHSFCLSYASWQGDEAVPLVC